MLPLLIPVVVGLTGAVAYKVHKKKAALTPQRKMILETALNKKLTSAEYLALADSFDKQGLKAEGTLLRNRAAFQDASPEKKLAWRMAFKKALSCEDPALVDKMAAAFKAQGATGAAADLTKYAQGLRDGTATPSPVPTASSGVSAPTIITAPPAVIPAPPVTPTAVAATTATPTVSGSTGAVSTPGSMTDPGSQGVPAPAASLAPVLAPAVAPSTIPAILPTVPVVTIPPAVVANLATAAALDASLQAAVGAPAAALSTATTSTPTVSKTSGATAAPNDLTTSMGQGTPQ